MFIAAILLAAGDGAIDGVPLALLPWADDTTLIEYQIEQLRASGAVVVVVVLGANADRIIPLCTLDDVEPIVDPRWESGEPSWLRVGASAVPRNTDAAIIAHVNEPRPADTYARLLEEHQRHSAAITCASVGGAPGRPLVIDRATLAAMRNLSDAGGLGTIISRYESGIALVPLEGELSVTIDTTEDYKRARSVLG